MLLEASSHHPRPSVHVSFRYIVPPEHGKRLERLAKGRISISAMCFDSRLEVTLLTRGLDEEAVCGMADVSTGYSGSLWDDSGSLAVTGSTLLLVEELTSVLPLMMRMFLQASFQEMHKAAKPSCVTR